MILRFRSLRDAEIIGQQLRSAYNDDTFPQPVLIQGD